MVGLLAAVVNTTLCVCVCVWLFGRQDLLHGDSYKQAPRHSQPSQAGRGPNPKLLFY